MEKDAFGGGTYLGMREFARGRYIPHTRRYSQGVSSDAALTAITAATSCGYNYTVSQLNSFKYNITQHKHAPL